MSDTPATPLGSRLIDVAGWTEEVRRGDRRPAADVRDLVDAVLAGTIDLDAFGRWLVALADLGESAGEIAGVAAALRSRMLPVHHAAAAVADTCGTGGDGSGSFNISTAAGIVVAAAGQPVAKHGNRAVSSRTGSADVLERLGVRVDASPDVSSRCLAELGLCFCLAPVHHPAMARVGPLRRSLGRPTVFNLVGPLCNPAGASVQVIGVGRPAAREPMAEAARLLGAARALVVSGHVGHDDAVGASKAFDEVSLFGPTDVIDVTPTGMTRGRWTPEDFGLATAPAAALADLEVAGPEESAAAIRDVLGGCRGPRRDVVVLNAAAVLWAAGRAPDKPAARSLADHAIDSGAAATLLERFAELSHAPAA
ncbi:MAG: anthranilate phosphoribosyltransferase [Planctomycetes bacterium]|nr:anthranilate phosphoribosyltransferase [Planctomycetota bacterium]